MRAMHQKWHSMAHGDVAHHCVVVIVGHVKGVERKNTKGGGRRVKVGGIFLRVFLGEGQKRISPCATGKTIREIMRRLLEEVFPCSEMARYGPIWPIGWNSDWNSDWIWIWI